MKPTVLSMINAMALIAGPPTAGSRKGGPGRKTIEGLHRKVHKSLSGNVSRYGTPFPGNRSVPDVAF